MGSIDILSVRVLLLRVVLCPLSLRSLHRFCICSSCARTALRAFDVLRFRFGARNYGTSSFLLAAQS